MRRVRRRDDDVGDRELRRQLVDADGLAAEALGQGDRAVVAPIGDEDGVRAASGERARGQLGGLACADQQHAARREVPEIALGELDGDRGNRDALLADRGLGASPLAGGERAADHPIQDRPGRALDERQLVGPLHLSLDFGLADDHRVESGGDPVEMPGRLGAAQRVQRPEQLGGADPGLTGEDAEPCRLGLDRVGGHQVELGPIAGGERDGFADRLLRDEPVEHACGSPLGQGELFAQRQRRGAMRDAEGEEAAHPRSPCRTASISCSRPCTCPTSRSCARARGRSARSASEANSRWMRWSFAAMIAT